MSSSEYIAMYCLAPYPVPDRREYSLYISRRRTSRYEKILSFATNTRGISRWRGWIFLADSLEKVARHRTLWMWVSFIVIRCMCTCVHALFAHLSYKNIRISRIARCVSVTEQRIRIINLSFQSRTSAVRSIRGGGWMHRWHNRWPLIAIRFPLRAEKIYCRAESCMKFLQDR